MKWLVILLGAVVVMSAACVNARFPTPTARPSPMPTATSVPATATAVTTGDGEDVQGDIAEGNRLFHTFQPAAGMACATCHRTDSDDRLVGPGLRMVRHRAQSRVDGQSAFDYLRTSIVDPGAYVVEGFPDLMPKNWGRVFTEAQLNDIIAYLISLSQ